MTYTHADSSTKGDEVTVTLYGKPQVWSAPTFSKNGAYDKKWKQKRDAYLLLSGLGLPLITLPCRAETVYYMQMPKAWSRKKRLEKDLTYHSAHIDLGNLDKLLYDTLQRALIIKDDCLIVEHETKKLWCIDPKTVVKLIPKTGEKK